MTSMRRKESSDAPKSIFKRCSARLFVSGDAPNSTKAKENLLRMCEEFQHV